MSNVFYKNHLKELVVRHWGGDWWQNNNWSNILNAKACQSSMEAASAAVQAGGTTGDLTSIVWGWKQPVAFRL